MAEKEIVKIKSMDLKKLEKLLQKDIPLLYQFAIALVPDKTAATEVLQNALQVLLVEGIDLVENYSHHQRKEQKQAIEKYLYGKIFELGKRVRDTKKNKKPLYKFYPEFYRLPLEQRGILFLKHKTAFNYDDLEEVVNLFRHEIISHLFDARDKMLASMGITENTAHA